MKVSPPSSEQELIQRVNALCGKTLGELAVDLEEPIPLTLKFAKGWIGQLLEKALGANAFNLDQPDFIELGIELKTLPIKQGRVNESTYICTASIPPENIHFEHSRVWRKIAKILWVPIDATLPLRLRPIGSAILWSPSPKLKSHLKQDWQELTEMMTLGRFEELSAHKGKYLQIRPKAANSKTFIKAINEEDQIISIVPKGFYLRSLLTQQIIEENYFF